MKKGKLVRVELQPGRFVKMYESDAIAKGLLKKRPETENKLRQPAGNKGGRPLDRHGGDKPGPGVTKDVESDVPSSVPPHVPPENVQAADFTVIAGIGPASARAIQARGIRTFEELRAVTDLEFLSKLAQHAIEQWRSDG